ncbi:MAG: acyl-CoA dehydrogenase [Novosphingobium sp.]|nr:acyl-CoA dehydrogenase [Novosphingobium sp.]
MEYHPPTHDQLFALRVCAGIEELSRHERFCAASPDVVEAIVAGIGELAAEVWAPLNRIGDRQGTRMVDGRVILPDGFAEAYDAYVAAGWNGIAAPEQFGGQGLPFSLAACVLENLGTANLAFSLLPMLTVGAIEALLHHGSEKQKATYLPRLVSGEWSGTMNLTEPQAGSDVGALRTMATPITEGPHAGKYRITGSKIFITWGEHDLTENIIHLLLARTPGSPAGSRGISLFIVPRFHVEDNSTIGPPNDLKAISLEHKLGIHASPTCAMSYGDRGECIGELVGAENEGLRAMFTMMNNARINVGAQGVMIAERATQKAMAYACARVQSARAGSPDKSPVAIIEHPDVRRMLLRMRSLTEAARALLYYGCGQIDRAALGDAAARSRADLLVPMIKAWCTDIGCEVASLGIQVHGGLGYIEETGVAQYLRDARIAPIYEGTNGIQAADLVMRKLAGDGGQAIALLMEDVARDAAGVAALADLVRRCRATGEWLVHGASLDDRLAGSVPFLAMCATAVAGWQLLRQSQASEREGAAAGLARTKPVIARWFLGHVVPETAGLEASVRAGADMLYALDAGELAGQ